MYIYTVEYFNNEYARFRDYVLAENDEECMNKFKMHRPNEKGFIIDWKRIDY